MNDYRNQPHCTLLNKLKYGIKTSLYDAPRVLGELRKFHKLVRKFRDG